MTVQEAVDKVLRSAVLRKDNGIVEAYREIYEGVKYPACQERALAAFRFGQLVGQEMKADHAPQPCRTPPFNNKEEKTECQ